MISAKGTVVSGNGRKLNPSDKNLNQSGWKIFENEVRTQAKDPGKVVEIRVEAIYNEGNLTNRPDAFAGSYRVNGGKWLTSGPFTNKR
jgi:hypothetical protein